MVLDSRGCNTHRFHRPMLLSFLRCSSAGSEGKYTHTFPTKEQLTTKPLFLRSRPLDQGSAAGGVAPLIRAPAPGPCPWHCRRPSVVTEGYIRLPPLPPTHLVLTSADSGSPPVHDYRCNLQCILRVVFKKHRFLQGFAAFAVSRFHLGDVKKPWVFHGFGSSEGVRNGKLDILTALVPT